MTIKHLTAIALSGVISATADASDFQLKNRSNFAAGEAVHNPFWPIGWVKSAPGLSAAPSVPVLSAESFVVTSILINNPPLAVINGKEIAEGEIIAMNIDNKRVLIQLASVQDGQVVLRCQDQNIVVPLRRRGEEKPLGARTALR